MPKNRTVDYDALALHLAGGQSLTEAAKRAGCSYRTATRRWADPDFKRQVAGLRAQILAEAYGRLVSLVTEAAEELGRLMQTSRHDHLRLAAARTVIEYACKLRDLVEVDQRLADLEESVYGEPRVISYAQANPGLQDRQA